MSSYALVTWYTIACRIVVIYRAAHAQVPSSPNPM
jgi:hypothetical protein